jgi:hypothetical protein
MPARALSNPDRTVTIYIHGYSGTGMEVDAPVGREMFTDDIEPLQEILDIPSAAEDSTAANQVAAVEYMGNRLPNPDDSYIDWDDYWELYDLFPPQGEGGIPLYAAVSAKFLRHVIERSGADAANLLGVSFGGAVTRYLMANDVDGVCSDGLITRWITLEGGVNGVWITQNPAAQPILELLGEDTIEIKHMSYHWMRRHVDPGQPGPNFRWSPPNWGTSASYRNTMIHHEISTDWSLNGGLIRKLGHLTNDGVICAGDAALEHVVDEYAWNNQQPTVQYLHAMHVPADPLPDHTGLEEHPGAWESLAGVMTGNRRVTLRLTQATAHKIHEGPLQGKGELVFELQVYSRLAADLRDVTMPIDNRNMRDGCAPMRRVARGETRQLDEVLLDQQLMDDEEVLDAVVTVRELDWSDLRNYRVFESLLHPNRIMAEESIVLDLSAPGPIQVSTDEVDLTFELDVLPLDIVNPQIADVEIIAGDDHVDLWWNTDEASRGSVAVHGDNGAHFIIQEEAGLVHQHHVTVSELRPEVGYRFTPRGEDAGRNLGRGPMLEREPVSSGADEE